MTSVETMLDEQSTPLLIIAHPLRPNVTVKLVHYGARVSEPNLSLHEAADVSLLYSVCVLTLIVEHNNGGAWLLNVLCSVLASILSLG